MSTPSESDQNGTVAQCEAARPLPPAAQRALAEAEERRRLREAAENSPKRPEIGGPAGPEPVRYGDWEKGGIAWDF